jgi:hypothetical protein
MFVIFMMVAYCAPARSFGAGPHRIRRARGGMVVVGGRSAIGRAVSAARAAVGRGWRL